MCVPIAGVFRPIQKIASLNHHHFKTIGRSVSRMSTEMFTVWTRDGRGQQTSDGLSTLASLVGENPTLIQCYKNPYDYVITVHQSNESIQYQETAFWVIQRVSLF